MQLRLAAVSILGLFAACTVAPAIPTSQVAERLATADIVVLGEHHDSPIVHQAHHQLLAELHSRRPQMIVSMEMFERDVQPLLSQYLAGECDEATFLAGSRPWPNYAADYRPVVEFCRTNKLPVIAANVPRPLASKVGKQGLESVVGDPNVAKVVSAPDDEYFAAFKQQMSDNPHGKKDEKKDEKAKDEKTKAEEKAMADDMVRRFYEAQCLKDDTMAESIARVFDEAKASGQNPLVVHFCGSFHSDYRRGTVQRLQSRLPTARILVVSVEEVTDAVSYIRAADSSIGDYVVALPESERLAKEQREKAESEAKKKAATAAAATGDAANEQGGRPALGLRPDYQYQGKGLRVDAVSEGGAAEAAGLKEGDVITGLDDQEVADLDGYMATLSNLTPGKTVMVKLQRDGQEKKIEVKVGTRRQ